GHDDLLGARVLAIDGVPLAKAAAMLSDLIPADNPMWAVRLLPALLRSPGYVAAAGLTSDPRAPLRLTVGERGGRTRESTVSPRAPQPDSGWIAADAATRAPLPL